MGAMNAKEIEELTGIKSATIRRMDARRLFALGVRLEIDKGGRRIYHSTEDDNHPTWPIGTKASTKEEKLTLECERLRAENKHLEERRRIELEAKREELESVKKARYQEAYNEGYAASMDKVRKKINFAGAYLRQHILPKIDDATVEAWNDVIAAIEADCGV